MFSHNIFLVLNVNFHSSNKKEQRNAFRHDQDVAITQELCPSPQATTARSSILQTWTRSSSPPVSTYLLSMLNNTKHSIVNDMLEKNETTYVL